jgi:hypothetical protein
VLTIGPIMGSAIRRFHIISWLEKLQYQMQMVAISSDVVAA